MAKSKAANARSKGIAYEGLVRKWFKQCFGFLSFDPSAGSGRKGSDIGFIGLPFIRGEAKNQKKMTLSAWLKQANLQAEQEGADIGFVIHKRHGIGNSIEVDGGIGYHYVTLRANDFARILLTLKENDIRGISKIQTPVFESEPEGKEDNQPIESESEQLDDYWDF